MNEIIKLLITIFYEFFKTGFLSFGGGLATIPFLKDMSLKYQWFSNADLINMIGISESTPGPMGVNMATYVGNTLFGPIGAIIATLALIIPSIIVIIIIANMFDKFKESKLIKDAMYLLRPSVVAFIICATLDIFIMTFFGSSFLELKYINIVLFLIIFIVYHKFKLHPVMIIMVCAILGIVFKL